MLLYYVITIFVKKTTTKFQNAFWVQKFKPKNLGNSFLLSFRKLI